MPDNQSIIVRPHVISTPSIVEIPQGLTIAEIVKNQIADTGVGTVQVEINGNPIPCEQWENYYPAKDDHILIYTTLGNIGDNPLRTILSLVVIAAAAWVSGGAGGAAIFAKGGALYFGGFGASIAGTTMATAGMLLVDKIAPVRGLQSNQQTYSDSPTYSIKGSSNTARPYGPIPVVLGRHKVYPDLCVKPYTEIEGNDEYLIAAFCWGYGPLRIEYIKILDTLVDDYNYVKIETFEGWDSDPDISLCPSIVDQIEVGVDLENSTGWVTRTKPAGADEISWDIEFYSGLMRLDNDGNRQTTSVVLDMEYRQEGGSWINLTGDVSFNAQYVNATIKTPGTYSIYARPSGILQVLQGTQNFETIIRIGQFEIEDIDEGEGTNAKEITSVIDLSPENVTGMVCSYFDEDTVSVTAGSVTFDAIAISDKSATAVRRGYRVSISRNYSYEIRIRRITPDNDDDDKIIDRCRWSFLRSITNDNPINFSQPLALTAIRIKASGQLNGIIDKLNGVCTSYAEIWDGDSWGGCMPTQNPAALARLVLMGPANFKARTTSQMDEETFGDWYELCESNDYEFNMVRDFTSSVWDTFYDIAASARAAPNIVDGKWSVIMDVDGKPLAQHITPRNSWGFSGRKQLFEMPHAFRVRFINEQQDYQWDERLVYDDGYTSANATIFESIEFPGVTNPDMIWKLGRYQIAQARLRPEEYTLYMDFEHLNCPRGSRVRCRYDVTLWGLGQGRIKELTTSGGNITDIQLDEEVTMEQGKTYSTRWRRENETSIVIAVDTQVGSTDTLHLTTPIPIASGPAVGDLGMFGETDQESTELLVKKVERQNDFVAKLTLEALAEDIYDADTGEIPDFDSNVTGPIDITTLVPGAPIISNIESGTVALEKVGATVRPRIFATCQSGSGSVRIGKYSVRYRIMNTIAWSYANGYVDEPTVIISDVIELEQYELQCQAHSIYGIPSAWSVSYDETVVGTSEVPSDVDNMRIEVVGDTAFLSWDAVTDLDLLGYKIKFSSSTSGATWETAYSFGLDLVPASAVSASAPARQGTYLIKAVDIGRRESANANSVTNEFSAILDMNVVETVTEHSSFSGTHEGTEVSGSILQLSESSGVMEVDDSGGMVLADEGDEITLGEMTGQGVLAEGIYYFANGVDLGAKYTSRVTVAMVSGGVNLSVDLFERDDWFDVDDFFGVTIGDWNIKAQLRHTNDDPEGSPTWSAWKTFNVGDFTCRAFEFRVILESLASGISPAISQLSVTVDMPDRIISNKDVSVSASGLHITFSPAFKTIKGFAVNTQDMDTGDYYITNNLSATGVDIYFYDSGDTGIARTMDYAAVGYGKVNT